MLWFILILVILVVLQGYRLWWIYHNPHQFHARCQARIQKIRLDERTEAALMPLLMEYRLERVTMRLMWIAGLNSVAAWRIAEDMEKTVQEGCFQRDHYTEQLRAARHAQYDALEGLLHFMDVSQTISQVDQMDRREFVRFVEDLLKKLGYENVSSCQMENGLDVDVVATYGGQTLVIQCKNPLPRYRVGIYAVELLREGMEQLGVERGMVVTSRWFTPEAAATAKEHGIELWDRGKLCNMLARSLLLSDAEKKQAAADRTEKQNAAEVLHTGGVEIRVDRAALDRLQLRVSDIGLVRSEDFVYSEGRDYVQIHYAVWSDERNSELAQNVVIITRLYRSGRWVQTFRKRIYQHEFYRMKKIEAPSDRKTVLEGLTRVEITAKRSLIPLELEKRL